MFRFDIAKLVSVNGNYYYFISRLYFHRIYQYYYKNPIFHPLWIGNVLVYILTLTNAMYRKFQPVIVVLRRSFSTS